MNHHEAGRPATGVGWAVTGGGRKAGNKVCSFLYFFSRIRTYVLTMAEKNLYISPPKPGTAPKALEKKCNKLVTLQNRSVIFYLFRALRFTSRT